MRSKIAIDTGPLKSGHKVRGVGFYTRELINALGSRVAAVDFNEVDLAQYDLIHYPYFSPFQKTLPLKKPTKVVVTIHDLTPLLYPKHYPPGIKGRINFSWQKLVIKKVDRIIADSETSKKDIVKFLKINPEKIAVVRLAPGRHFRELKMSEQLRCKKKFGLPDFFVLYVGEFNYNKNIPGLIKAMKFLDVPLVLVGKQAGEIENQDLSHPELRHLKEILPDLKNNPRIIRLGFVTDADLVAIYNLATVYCEPSFYEGFGLPVLQAMACGTPVVAAQAPALAEIGENACLYADPESPEDMAQKIKKILDDQSLQKELAQKGQEQAKKFSWAKTAAETMKLYEEVLSK
jgi:glycosyltransferase involved in cell wall biosynthesis